MAGSVQRKEVEKDGRGWREEEEEPCNFWEIFGGEDEEEELDGWSEEEQEVGMSEEFKEGESGELFSCLATM